MPVAIKPENEPLIGSRRAAGALVALLLAAAVLRCMAMAVQWDQLSLDPDAYRLIAENLRQHGVFSRSAAGRLVVPTAFRPPLYPLLLAATAWQGRVTPWSVAALHVLLGTLTVLLTLWLASGWHLGRWSWLAATLVACDPILLSQSAQVMTETLATLLSVAGLLSLTRWSNTLSWQSAGLSGLVLGTGTLCRPTFLVWTALIMIFVVFYDGRWRGMKRAAVMLAGFLVLLLPWAIRNQLVMGRAVLATTHGGYTLLLGNNPYFYLHLRTSRWGQVWDARELSPMLSEAPTSEAGHLAFEHAEFASDRRFYQLARETIRQDPAMFAYASLVRVARLWSPLPHRLSDDETSRRAAARWAVALWYVIVFLGALTGLAVRSRRTVIPPWVWGLLCVLAFTMVHSVYWSNMRMRAPLMPVVYLVFVLGCGGICGRGTCRKLFVIK